MDNKKNNMIAHADIPLCKFKNLFSESCMN